MCVKIPVGFLNVTTYWWSTYLVHTENYSQDLRRKSIVKTYFNSFSMIASGKKSSWKRCWPRQLASVSEYNWRGRSCTPGPRSVRLCLQTAGKVGTRRIHSGVLYTSGGSSLLHLQHARLATGRACCLSSLWLCWHIRTRYVSSTPVD